MDVVATLIEITAFDPTAGEVFVGRITNRNDPRATTANNREWLPVLQTAPSVGTSVFNGTFTGAGQIDLGDFTITLADGLGDVFARLAWSGADIKIYGGDMRTGVYNLIYRATGDSAQRKGRLELQVSLTTRASLLDVNVLTQSYAGTGLLEGDAGLKGLVKPWVFGNARFCKPVLIDPVRQIYQVSAYGPVENISNVYEGGQEIPSVSDYGGTLTDFLTGPGPAQGTWWRYNRNGLFRLGSQPTFPITCTAKGDTSAVVNGAALTRIGDIIARIVSLTTTMPIKPSSLAALNAAVPQPVDLYFDAQTTVTEVMTSLLLSVGGYYTFDESGNVIFGLVRFGSPSFSLDNMNRQEPTVLGVNAMPTSSPVWDLRLGAEQCHFVHDASSVTEGISQADRDAIAQAGTDASNALTAANSKNKTFPPSNTPPTGPIDGDQWPDTSVSPTTMRRYSFASNTWVATSNQITTANQVPYAGGQTVESLKPAQAGSDVTIQNTAAAIASQAWAATNGSQTKVDNGYVPTGRNQVVLSNFARGLQGFKPGARSISTSAMPNGTAPGTLTTGLNFPGYYGSRNVAYGVFSETLMTGDVYDLFWTPGPWGGDSLASGNGYMMAVKKDDKVYWRALMARHRCDAQLYFLIFNQNGALVEAPGVFGGRVYGGSYGDPANFDPVEGLWDVKHSEAAFAILMVRMVGNGGGNPYVFFTEPAMGILPAGQLVIPPYSDGPSDPLSDRTIDNTAQTVVGQGSLATRNNVTGDEVINGSIRNSDGSVVWDLNDASGRRRIIKNGYRLVEGAAFGASSDLIQWYGPNSVGYGQETKTNGVFAFATDGRVYYGAAVLGSGGGSSKQTVVLGGTITKTIPAGGSIDFEASLYANAGGSNGTIRAQVVGGPAGGSQSQIGIGDGSSIGPSEPGSDFVSGTYINSTGMTQAFTFSLNAVRQPGSAGGGAIPSQSYLTI